MHLQEKRYRVGSQDPVSTQPQETDRKGTFQKVLRPTERHTQRVFAVTDLEKPDGEQFDTQIFFLLH